MRQGGTRGGLITHPKDIACTSHGIRTRRKTVKICTLEVILSVGVCHILNNFVGTLHVSGRTKQLLAHPAWLYENRLTLRKCWSPSSRHPLSALFERVGISHQSAVQRYPRLVKVYGVFLPWPTIRVH